MDSVVGAMTLANYYHLKHEKLYVPLINTTRSTFALKLEILQHLQRTLASSNEQVFDFVF